MKIFKKILGIIAMGAVIAIGMSACITLGAPKEMDEETLALKEKLDSASWEVKAMSRNWPLLGDFEEVKNMELTAFQNISVTQNLELDRWYALSAPELPGTYYIYSKFKSGSSFGSPRHNLYKSTKIDAETFASITAFSGATWQPRALPGQPSTAGLERVDWLGPESMFFGNILLWQEDDRYDKWFSFTAQEMPGVIYYYFERTPAAISIGETKTVYKGRQ